MYDTLLEAQQAEKLDRTSKKRMGGVHKRR